MFSSLWVSEQYKNTALSFKVKEILFSKQSKFQKVEIIDTYDWGRIMMLDGMMMVTEKDEFFYHETISHLPMALLKDVKKTLVIGGGDGGTIRELAKYPSVEKIDLVEIDDVVVKASKKCLPELSTAFSDERVSMFFEDAAEFIKNAEAESYDLIIVDSSDPEGFAECLIGTDFYHSIKKALTENGLFISQSSSPLSQTEDFKKTWRNLNFIFPYNEIAWSLIPTYPGAFWSFVLASKSEIKKELAHDFVPENCKFWKPEMLQALLCRPNYIASLIQ